MPESKLNESSMLKKESFSNKTKWVVLTGGVLSGLGKGIASASIGMLLSSRYKVIPIKCDGYLNVDPGTMNPVEHGEVFVLEDGGEVDMDFGHYERFLGVACKSEWNLTMGKVFDRIRAKERKGDYLGKTVQLIPHVSDLIREWWLKIAEEEEAEVVMIEIGGTVGDMENELYIEAARNLKKSVGAENIMYAHLTYVPIPSGVNEQKSKPTQQSVNLLRERGITPNLIIGRCQEMLAENIKNKIAMFCDIKKEAVISGVDVDNIYKIPVVFQKENVNAIINENLGLDVEINHSRWKELVDNMSSPKKEINIAICGKYTILEDSYASVVEALRHSGAHLNTKVNIGFVETSDKTTLVEILKDVDGVIIPGGFGSRGIEGKIDIIKYCRENKLPILGICYGLQLMVVESARNLGDMADANTTEVNPETTNPVIIILPGQEKISDLGGTLRLGAYPAILTEGTKAHELYGLADVSERHRHRYEVNPEYHEKLLETGLVFSGMSPDGKLVEFTERADHPYFLGCQGHPELKSTLLKPAPLFFGLVKAALENKDN